MIGFKTIKQGERYALWSSNGKVKTVDGPKKVFLLNQDLQKMELFTAKPDEYLVVNFKDGNKQHIKGPTSLWFDPVIHHSIHIEQMINLEDNEVILVYSQSDKSIVKRIIQGPEIYMPNENEWTHQFSWHGTINPLISNKKSPHVLKFKKLRLVPDQMYFDIDDVRTLDDALIIVKVMIFFEIENLKLMLTQTHDPIADFINSITSDIIDFASNQTFEQFKENTNKLNDLNSYSQLTTRSERMGYKISKVVYRGYLANPKLQEMHNNAIEARTKLKLESETEDQAQKLADFKLDKENQRSHKKRDIEEKDIIHKNKMSQILHEEKIRQLQIENDLKIQEEKMINELTLDKQIKINQSEQKILSEMNELGIDLTKFLTAKYQRIDNLVRIDSEYNPNLHIHSLENV